MELIKLFIIDAWFAWIPGLLGVVGFAYVAEHN